MSQFGITQHTVKLAHVNARRELHGEENVLACDLKIEADLAGKILERFHPSLQSALFCKPSPGASDLDDQAKRDDPEHMPAVKFGLMGPVKWGATLVGATVIVHAPVSTNDMEISDCEVDNFEITAKEGGIVGVKFRIKAHPSQAVIGKLCGMIQTDIDLTVRPPKAPEQL